VGSANAVGKPGKLTFPPVEMADAILAPSSLFSLAASRNRIGLVAESDGKISLFSSYSGWPQSDADAQRPQAASGRLARTFTEQR
jgi:hypothetical protein